MYDSLRQGWLNKLCIPENFHNLEQNEKLKMVLNEAKNVRHTAQYLVSVMDLRCLLARAVGVAVGRRSGEQLATTLVATISTIIFFFFFFLRRQCFS